MIPVALLPQRISIEPYLGDSAYGPQYGPKVSGVPARVEGRRRAVRRPDGSEVISTATITIRPNVTCPTESRIEAPHPMTGLDEVFEVLEVLTMAGYRRPAGFEVMVA